MTLITANYLGQYCFSRDAGNRSRQRLLAVVSAVRQHAAAAAAVVVAV